MASGEDMVDGYISSLLADSLKTNQNGDDLSPEDITWADSCLIKDSDISDGDWNSMKDALIEILGLQHDSVASHNSAAPMTDDFFGGTDIEMLQSAKPGIVNFARRTNADVVSFPMNNDEMETANDEFPVEEGAEYSLSEHFRDISETSLRNVFLPNYKDDIQKARETMREDIQETMSSQNEAFSYSTYESEPSTQEIFKVWDLGIQPEDDELFKQLTKVLSESPDHLVVASTTDYSRAYKDLEEQSLDDLTAGLADLSLNQQSN
ncbi:hypothetical protein M5689_021797 [Euphorbia peplus]|nr:hypothetical protein M5689_021797 [Euphorbia peplus]